MIRGNFGWVVWGWFVFGVLSYTFVFDISDISTISIIDGIGDNLGATIGKIYTVFTIGSITITVFIGSKVSSRVIVGNSIAILVDSWSVISRFWMIWSWLVVGWSWVNNWLMNNWGYIRSWLVDNWSMVWGWFVVYWGWVVWCSMVDWSMMSISWGMDWSMSWSMDCSTIFFLGIRVVDILWCSMGLAGDNGMIRSMGPMDSMAYRWSVTMLDDLVAALVGQGNSQKGGKGNEYLEFGK